MSGTQASVEEAIAEPELIGGGEPEGSTGIAQTASSRKRDAFSELMDPSKRPKKPSAKTSTQEAHGGRHLNRHLGGDGLGPYISDPSHFTSREIIYNSPSFVAIRDAYPKASVHALLLPRDQSKTLMHPIDAFEDAEFLASVRAEVLKLKRFVASELRRMFGKDSASERPRLEAMERDPPPDVDIELPPGRDWEAQLITGIHAGPSMNHLHVHVLSVDHVSACMKHRKHYNSFKTPFFVRLDEFPLARDDPRRMPNRGGHLDDDLLCWRCGRNFGNKFAQLKSHLDKEFHEWKKE